MELKKRFHLSFHVIYFQSSELISLVFYDYRIYEMHFHNPNESIPTEHDEYKNRRYKQFSKTYNIAGITIS